MKRVLCIVSAMNTGGAETFLMKIYRRLDREKYQMDFCVNTKEKCFYDDEISALGGKMFYVPAKSQSYREYKKSLYNVVKNNGYEYVLRITSNAAGFLDLKIAKKAGARVCVARSSNSSDGDSAVVNLIHKISRPLFVKYVDVKIAPSDLAAEYTFGKRSVRLGEVEELNNAIDLDVYKYSDVERQKIRRELSIEGKTVIGHIGRFSKQKNHNFLIDIFADIRKKDENAHLLLLGKGELLDEVKQKVETLGLSDCVTFAGVRGDVPSVLSAMDVFLLPSFYEGMPNTVIEAQATGLPCVIADTITREANVSGLVSYLSLDTSSDMWAKNVLEANGKRCDTSNVMREKGYDIESSAKKFVKIIFEK